MDVIPGKGIRVDLADFNRLRAFQSSGELWGREQQDLLRHATGLGRFLPEVTEDPASGTALFQLVVDGRDVVSTSKVRQVRDIPANEIRDFEEMLGKLKDLSDTSKDTKADPTKVDVIKAFRLPDPFMQPDFYRVYKQGGRRRLLVLWGCEKVQGSSVDPMMATHRLEKRQDHYGGLRAAALVALILLLLLAGVLFGPGLFRSKTGALVKAPEPAATQPTTGGPATLPTTRPASDSLTASGTNTPTGPATTEPSAIVAAEKLKNHSDPAATSGPSQSPLAIASSTTQPAEATNVNPSPTTHPSVASDTNTTPTTRPAVAGDTDPSPATRPAVATDPRTSPATHPAVASDSPTAPATHPAIAGVSDTSPTTKPAVASNSADSPTTRPAISGDSNTSPTSRPAVASDSNASPATHPAIANDSNASPGTHPAVASNSDPSPATRPAADSNLNPSPASRPAVASDSSAAAATRPALAADSTSTPATHPAVASNPDAAPATHPAVADSTDSPATRPAVASNAHPTASTNPATPDHADVTPTTRPLAIASAGTDPSATREPTPARTENPITPADPAHHGDSSTPPTTGPASVPSAAAAHIGPKNSETSSSPTEATHDPAPSLSAAKTTEPKSRSTPSPATLGGDPTRDPNNAAADQRDPITGDRLPVIQIAKESIGNRPAIDGSNLLLVMLSVKGVNDPGVRAVKRVTRWSWLVDGQPRAGSNDTESELELHISDGNHTVQVTGKTPEGRVVTKSNTLRVQVKGDAALEE